MVRHFFVVLMLIAAVRFSLSAVTLTGIIISSDDKVGVAYASISEKGKSGTVLSDASGHFKIVTTSANPTLIVSALGYQRTEVAFTPAQVSYPVTIELNPTGIAIPEVVVRPRKEKYSKRNNPAVDLSRVIAANRERNNPRNNPYYNFDRYDRYALGFNNVKTDKDGSGNNNLMLSKFSFLKDYVDTCEITGKQILILSVRENASHNHFRKSPKKEVTVISASNQNGLDDFLDQENMRVFLDDILGDIDIFKNDVPLLQNRFVSPFSPIAPDFYRFYITDTVTIEGDRYTELTFVPRNAQSFGFTGKLYVNTGDPNTFVRRISLNVPRDINLNFVERLFVSQDYKRMSDSTIVKVSEDIAAEVEVMPGLPGLYMRKHSIYGKHDFERPANEASIFDRVGNKFEEKNATARDSAYWAGMRFIPLHQGEGRVTSLSQRLRANKLYYWTEKVMKVAFLGYINTAKESKIDIGPVNTIFSHNELEGYRFRLGAMTTANLCKRLFARGYVAFGTKDKKWKYHGELEYSFNDRKYHAREFPIHSIRGSYEYDVDMLGQHFTFTNPDNMFLSLRRKKDFEITYRRRAAIDYTLELRNNFSVTATLAYARQYATDFMTFIRDNGVSDRHYGSATMKLQLRYAPGEKFYQSKTHRYPISLDAPVICISHEYGPKGLWGSRYTINVTELSMQKRFWFSSFGYLDALVKGGHIWSATPYPNLLLPNANLSYTIQPESYSLMNPMEFANDSYASADLTYWANGAIFNYIPLIKKLKLREVVQFKALWGHLSKRNDPAYNTSLYAFPSICEVHRMGKTPYMELSAGVENIFKVLRVDYVWRLTYRNNPGISKRGVRIALHVTF